MKIKYEDKQSKLVGEIKIGTVFCGTIDKYFSIFLRFCGGVVDLQDPKYAWIYDFESCEVHDYEELSAEVSIS